MATVAVVSRAEMDDGRTLTVTVDQRDLARAEAQGVDNTTRHTYIRFVVWSALSRTGQYAGPWEIFNETDCVEATDEEPEEPAGDEDGLDPGRKDRSASI
jgi:hypothetical protein